MTAQSLDFTISAELHADIQQARKRALALGVLGAILCASAFFLFGQFKLYSS